MLTGLPSWPYETWPDVGGEPGRGAATARAASEMRVVDLYILRDEYVSELLRNSSCQRSGFQRSDL